MRTLLIIMLFFITSSCSAKIYDYCNNCNNKSDLNDKQFIQIENFYGKWKIVNVENFRGSLTTKEEAEKELNKIIIINKDCFTSLYYGNIKDPIYKYEKYENKEHEEGLVFRYGEPITIREDYMSDRQVVHQIFVYNQEDKKLTGFEILSENKIIYPFDGYIYTMERIK